MELKTGTIYGNEKFLEKIIKKESKKANEYKNKAIQSMKASSAALKLLEECKIQKESSVHLENK